MNPRDFMDLGVAAVVTIAFIMFLQRWLSKMQKGWDIAQGQVWKHMNELLTVVSNHLEHSTEAITKLGDATREGCEATKELRNAIDELKEEFTKQRNGG